jgi:hypothetical protein
MFQMLSQPQAIGCNGVDHTVVWFDLEAETIVDSDAPKAASQANSPTIWTILTFLVKNIKPIAPKTTILIGVRLDFPCFPIRENLA